MYDPSNKAFVISIPTTHILDVTLDRQTNGQTEGEIKP